jgi:hypothetical protein
MSFLAYLAMLIVVMSSLALGFDWVVSPPDNRAIAQEDTGIAVPRPAASIPMPAAPAPTPKVTSVPIVQPAAAPPAQPASRETAPPDGAAATPTRPEKTTTAQSPQETSDASADSPAPRCNVQACSAAYQSFRESDCTYQPYDGPRRLCGKK